MKVTDVRIRIGKKPEVANDRLKAHVDITFEDSFVIHGLKIIDGQNGLFVAMPSRKMPNGEFKDIVHPITPELRQEITKLYLINLKKKVIKQKNNFFTNKHNNPLFRYGINCAFFHYIINQIHFLLLFLKEDKVIFPTISFHLLKQFYISKMALWIQIF